MCADIAKMFRQILVHPDDRHVQAIFWQLSPYEQLLIFILITVVYGLACSPYLALRVLAQLAKDKGPNYPLAAFVLGEITSNDDSFMGADDLKQAIAIRDQLIEIPAAGQLFLREWAGNSLELLAGLSTDDYGVAVDIASQPETDMEVLGITWSPSHDISL